MVPVERWCVQHERGSSCGDHECEFDVSDLISVYKRTSWPDGGKRGKSPHLYIHNNSTSWVPPVSCCWNLWAALLRGHQLQPGCVDCGNHADTTKPATDSRRLTFELVQEWMWKVGLSFVTFWQFGTGAEGADDTGSQTCWTTRKKIPLSQTVAVHDKLPAEQKWLSGFSLRQYHAAVLVCRIVFSYYPCLLSFGLYLNLVWDVLWPWESL